METETIEHSNYELVKVTIERCEIDYALVKRLSKELAPNIVKDPMVVAWLDEKKGEEHPAAPECQHKPGWLAYADGHGGRVRAGINEEEYSIIFSDQR